MNVISTAVTFVGAIGFGAVVGWMTGHSTRHAKSVDVKWLGSMVLAIGGSAITQTLGSDKAQFGTYAVALAFSYFVYVFNDPMDIDLDVWQAVDADNRIRYEGSRADCLARIDEGKIGDGACLRRAPKG